MKFYFAGKIGRDDWRHSIVLGLRDAIRDIQVEDYGHGDAIARLPEEWPVLRGAVLGQHDYVGPFFMPPIGETGIQAHGDNRHGNTMLDNDNGWTTGAVDPETFDAMQQSHRGMIDDSDTRKHVIRLCFQAILKADAVFTWMDSRTAYGTLVELGFAIANRKPIWWASPARPYDNLGEDFWFAKTTADAVEDRANDAKTALENILSRKFKPQINGYVYLIRSGDFIKIGKSKNVDNRLTQISPKTPMPVTLLHSIACEDMSQVEAALHRRFAHYRTNGEWFLLPREELNWLLTIKTVGRTALLERPR